MSVLPSNDPEHCGDRVYVMDDFRLVVPQNTHDDPIVLYVNVFGKQMTVDSFECNDYYKPKNGTYVFTSEKRLFQVEVKKYGKNEYSVFDPKIDIAMAAIARNMVLDAVKKAKEKELCAIERRTTLVAKMEEVSKKLAERAAQLRQDMAKPITCREKEKYHAQNEDDGYDCKEFRLWIYTDSGVMCEDDILDGIATTYIEVMKANDEYAKRRRIGDDHIHSM